MLSLNQYLRFEPILLKNFAFLFFLDLYLSI